MCRRLRPFGFRGRRLALGIRPAKLGMRLLCIGCSRLLPLHTAPIISRVFGPADAALRLHWTGWAVTGKVRTPISDASMCVTAVSLRVAEALAAFAL